MVAMAVAVLMGAVMVMIMRAGVVMPVIVLALLAADLHNRKHARGGPLQHIDNNSIAQVQVARNSGQRVA